MTNPLITAQNLIAYPQYQGGNYGQLIDAETNVIVNPDPSDPQSPSLPYKKFQVTQGSLTSYGLTLIDHSFGKYPSGIQTQNSLGEMIIVPVAEQTEDVIVLDFSDFMPIQGTFIVTLGI
jgi:hypothetical protein